MRSLCAVHGRRGLAYEVGLGFYAFMRFHVDTSKYRRWNMDPAVATHCPALVRPVIIASAPQAPIPTEKKPELQAGSAASPSQSPGELTQPQPLPTVVPLIDAAPVPPIDPLAPQQ